MSQNNDFEHAWLAKFSRCLEEMAGIEIRDAVIAGSESLSDQSDRQDVIAWSQGAMERLDSLVDAPRRQAVMAGCACQYPKSALQGARQAYASNGDIDQVHQMLQEQFEAFLRESLKLQEEHVQDVISRGWGLAGVKQGDTIVATKIPKSGNLAAYLEESDPEKRQQAYCHCPRVRDVLKSGETISPTYCYCGAGFYKGIWEEITQKPVEVELLASVLQGDEVCTIAIHLP